MSKIGLSPIEIPSDAKVEQNGDQVNIVGPKGKLNVVLPKNIEAKISKDKISFSRKNDDPKTRGLHGLIRSLSANAIMGVTSGWQKQLELKGIGYRAEISENKLILQVGFTHPVNLQIPSELDINVEKNLITISGIDKQLVGQFAAKIRMISPPEPYKGKGIRYFGEIVKLKPGKQAVKSVT